LFLSKWSQVAPAKSIPRASSGRSFPVAAFKGHAHFLGDLRNGLDIISHRFFPSMLRLEDFPLLIPIAAACLCSRPPAGAPVRRGSGQLDAALSAGKQFNSGGAAKTAVGSDPASGGHANHDAFGVALM